MFRKINNPIVFQGNLNKKNYFEGWYFKQVNQPTGQSISFIPGISLSEHDSHCFIQVIIGPQAHTYYYRFDSSDFSVCDNPFQVNIRQNWFSESGCHIELDDGSFQISGTLQFEKFKPIQRNLYMPTIMGPFAYIRGMECNHGVISMQHQVNGTLMINQSQWDFVNQKGYLEKDWGISFPKRYIWLQGHHFEDEDVSMMLSVATIPFLTMKFEGLIGVIHIGNQEIRLATYLGGRMQKIKTHDQGFDVIIKQSDYTILVYCTLLNQGELKAPTFGKMTNTIKEGLGGKITLEIIKKGELPRSYTSEHCGIEIVGY